MELKNKKIVVTGGAGFLGSWVVSELKHQGAKHIFIPRASTYDLREKEVCNQIVKNQDIVVHIAAHVGGIALNKAHPGQLFYDNAVMGIHLLEEARRAKVKKVLLIGTACSYPKYCPVPFKEEDLWSGYPDEITGIYGLAKKMLWVQAEAYRQEYGLNTIYLIPVNIYGPKDHFDPQNGHVISALIMRMIEAKRKRQKTFTVWGSGLATREFIYVADAAAGIVSALREYNSTEPINLGTGNEISISDLVSLLKELIGYSGVIKWDSSKPEGQPRRMMDTTRAKKQFGFEAKTPLAIGLAETIKWYEKQYPKFN